MRRVLFVRNDPWETFGVAPDVFRAAGLEITVLDAIDPDAPRPPDDGHAGVVVFGSSFNVEHADEQPFIKEVAGICRTALDRGTPLLGVCFGAQLLAWAAGAPVSKAVDREVGFEPVRPTAEAAADPLLSHYVEGDMVFEWHMDTFELPEGAELLATGDRVRNQAFRLGDRAWGVQFHFEIDRPEIELWLDGFAKQGDLEVEWGKSAAQVRREAAEHLAAHEDRGREVFRRFADVACEAT